MYFLYAPPLQHDLPGPTSVALHSTFAQTISELICTPSSETFSQGNFLLHSSVTGVLHPRWSMSRYVLSARSLLESLENAAQIPATIVAYTLEIRGRYCPM